MDGFYTVHDDLWVNLNRANLMIVDPLHSMKELTEPVKLALEESQKSLREALTFAAKTEYPRINLTISQIMLGVEQVLNYYERSRNPFEMIFRQDIGE